MRDKSFFRPILFMAVLTLIFAGSLAAVNAMTKERRDFNQEAELRRKILYVFDALPEKQDDASIEEAFDRLVVRKEVGGKPGFALMENGEPVAYALQVDGSGLWGSVVGYLGIRADLSEIIGLDFTKQSETPGLGGRIEEDPYKEQFRSIPIDPNQSGPLIANRPAPGGNIDAISGATQTSNSVVILINEDLEAFLKNPEVK